MLFRQETPLTFRKPLFDMYDTSSTTAQWLHLIYLVNQYIYRIFWDMLHNLHFFTPQKQNAVYFTMSSFLFHKIFKFYIKEALKFKCPTPLPKG
jgi:cytochrome c oxidase assembly factor CtaG